MRKSKLYAGVGARATVLKRFVTPSDNTTADDVERLKVILVGQNTQQSQGRQKETYNFRLENDSDDRPLLSANARYVKIVAEGDPHKFFDPNALEKKLRALEQFVEPRIKWQKSRAKDILMADINEGIVPLDDKKDQTTDAKAIYLMHPEYSDYDPDKFAGRLRAARVAIKSSNSRVIEDTAAFEIYKSIHECSVMSNHGYGEYQGSESQRLLRKDIEQGLHISMGKKELFALRPEYYNEFPLHVFRDKIYQEIRTAKYLHTCKVQGKLHKSS
jgi:hypothetical protein